MSSERNGIALAVALAGLILFVGAADLAAATLTVAIERDEDVIMVGAFRRWDGDGNLRRKVNPKAVIDVPEVDAKARRVEPGKWVFENLPPGKYDLVLLGKDRLRIEGWEYAPVLEFDPFFPPTAKTEKETRQTIIDGIKKSRHYENKVVPLALGGDEKTVRVLVMLLRDLPTSYTKGSGTLRFEIWQYTEAYGAWVKERRTRVMHRLLVQVSDIRRWTWLWDPALGAIAVAEEPVSIECKVPTKSERQKMPGLHPY